jgi:hypothetical protein
LGEKRAKVLVKCVVEHHAKLVGVVKTAVSFDDSRVLQFIQDAAFILNFF